MTDRGKDRKGFMEYMALAKQELQAAVQRHPELGKLSHRELEVLTGLLSDKTQSQIAEELYISDSAVHFHCKNIYKKLEVSGRRQILIRYKDL